MKRYIKAAWSHFKVFVAMFLVWMAARYLLEQAVYHGVLRALEYVIEHAGEIEEYTRIIWV